MLLRRFLGTRLAGFRDVANELLEGLDDRSRLLAMELAAERQRLMKLVVAVLAALVAGVIALVWATATVVAFAWDTPWRATALLGLLAFWTVCALALAWRARGQLKVSSEAFPMSREVVKDDLARLREVLR